MSFWSAVLKSVRRQPAARTAPLLPLRATPPRRDVLYFGAVDWAGASPRRRALLERLARRGHRVFYVSPVFTTDSSFRSMQAAEGVCQVSLPEPAASGGAAREEALYRVLLDFIASAGLNETLCRSEAALWQGPAGRLKRDLGFSGGRGRPRGRASVVVVSYNGLELTRLCVDSLLAKTAWPDWELIVVDNGSSDGSAEYLRALERRLGGRAKVLLNPDNRGFAAACNQGLREAVGDYLVLLNNDTVVTHGWLGRLLRRLEEPGVGLVGPVTNEIGNEARVPADYRGPAEMEAFAQSRTLERLGRAFDIPVLALFCAAMKRELLEKVGFLDERYGVGLFEDDDFSRAVQRAGLRTLCVEDVFIHHEGRAAFKKLPRSRYRRLFERNRALFEEKWGEVWLAHRYRDSESMDAPERPDVVYLAPVEWAGPIQRPQHFARLIAPHGRFAYVNPVASRGLRLGDFARVPLSFGARAARPGAAVRTFAFWHLPWIARWADALNARLFELQSLRRLRPKPGYSLIVTTPSVLALTLIERTRPGKVIYDCMDHYAAFHRGRAAERMRELERMILRRCDRVVVSSETLRQRMSALHSDVVLAPNGVDFERFAAAAAGPGPGRGPTLGYCGTIGEWVDFELLEALAREFPEATLVLAGPWRARGGRGLLKHANVRWLGEQPYERVPEILAGFDVGLIPFVRDALTEYVNPIKLYEYLAAGLPVVGTETEELRAHEPHLKLASDRAGFCRAVRAALLKKGGVEERRRYAANFDWGRTLKPYFGALGLEEPDLIGI